MSILRGIIQNVLIGVGITLFTFFKSKKVNQMIFQIAFAPFNLIRNNLFKAHILRSDIERPFPQSGMQKFMADLLGNAQEQLNQAQGQGQGQSSSSSSKPKKKKGSKAPELKGPLAVVGKLLNQESGSTVLTPKEAIQKQQKQQMESSKQGKGKKSNKEHGNASVGGANSKASGLHAPAKSANQKISDRKKRKKH
ncbi:MAG: hypothetical protein EZS28_004561 [Streblomastix strix]|uniref:Uncharacterized protein n=1 Tax=Streblomastix strix TaxID=222440 RepID=A0A5J4WYI1_9EUKA|nr:MAG: hypothetical protein EZS28_004561 [Streblomastix strix]